MNAFGKKKKVARAFRRRAMGVRVQLLYKTDLSAEDYVTNKSWRDATLEACPFHPNGGCSWARHGAYERKTPRKAHMGNEARIG